MEELENRMAEAAIHKSPLAIALFDIDRFKSINDTKGHLYGDKVLTEVARIIENSLREADSAGRYGGEEFIVILPNADKANGLMVAERIRHNIEEHDFGYGQRVTVSGGVKQYQGEEIAGFVEEADRRLYDAKNGGRNRISG